MEELIETIRVATNAGANAEQKASGARSCRMILAALETEPGRPIVLPDAPATVLQPGLDLERLLEVAIARLRHVASTREQSAPAQPAGPRLEFVRPPDASSGPKRTR